MQYHQPDSRWNVFNINDFETYVEKAVIKGLFHPIVPKDVVQAYEMAEYVMAHAYYHYPLYDEALSKVLRIIEMAVKLRCLQLNVSLTQLAKRKGRECEVKRPLKQLMGELIEAEPEKDLKNQFEVARSLRNSLMHPDRHIYSGAMSKGYIKQSISLLNTLFLPPKLFAGFSQHLHAMRKQLENLQSRPLVLETAGSRFLVEDTKLEVAAHVNKQWQYLLACYPIMPNAYENLKNHNYLKPLCFFIRNASVSEKKLEAIIENTNQVISIAPTDHPTNLNIYSEWVKGKEAVTENERMMYNHCLSHEVGECENEFWYTRLYKVNG